MAEDSVHLQSGMQFDERVSDPLVATHSEWWRKWRKENPKDAEVLGWHDGNLWYESPGWLPFAGRQKLQAWREVVYVRRREHLGLGTAENSAEMAKMRDFLATFKLPDKERLPP